MTSIVNSSGVDLSTPSGISGDVTVPDNASGTKIAAAVVDVNPADGSATQPAIIAELATIAAALSTTQLVALTTAQVSALAPLAVQPVSDAGGSLTVDTGTPGQPLNVALTTAQIAALQVSNNQDGLGNPINSLTAGTGQNGLMIAVGATNYFASTANSSTTQLGAGATFSGVIENAYNEPAISILLTSDQPGTLVINQYIDLAGSRVISSWPFTITAGQPFSRAFTLNGNYVSVAFQNTGSSATTTFNLNTAYGTIPAVTQQGNAPMALYDANGVAVGSDLYGGQAFLHVDTSHAATDGAAYNNSSVPQVGVMAGHGVDGNVHAIATDANGNQNVNVVNLSASQAVTETNLTAAQSSDSPVFVALSGDPTGDFANVNLLEELISGNSGLDLGVRITNLPAQDAQKALKQSDAPSPIWLQGVTGAILTIDTTGYQSLNITTGASFAANVTASDDGVTWSALSGSPRVLGALVTTVAATTGYSFPCIARYIRFTLTAAGTATAYLRAQPWNGTYTTTVPTSTASNNIAQIAGTAPVTAGVAGTLAIGGNVADGSAPTLYSQRVGGTDATGKLRTILTDTLGAIQVGQESSNLAQGASSETLLAILGQMKVMTFYMKELSVALNQGTYITDDEAAILADPSIFN